ncbi:MAG: hypothetical protein HYX48_00135 [Chlamydiales bacterium]|nr:hypothetical protein [Chlamydiales bacterium]
MAPPLLARELTPPLSQSELESAARASASPHHASAKSHSHAALERRGSTLSSLDPLNPAPSSSLHYCAFLQGWLPEWAIDLLESFCCWIASLFANPIHQSNLKELGVARDDLVRSWEPLDASTEEIHLVVNIKLALEDPRKEPSTTNRVFVYRTVPRDVLHHDIESFIQYALRKTGGKDIHSFDLDVTTLTTHTDQSISGSVRGFSYSPEKGREVLPSRRLESQEPFARQAAAIHLQNGQQIIDAFGIQETAWRLSLHHDAVRDVILHIVIRSQNPGVLPKEFQGSYTYKHDERGRFHQDLKQFYDTHILPYGKETNFNYFELEIIELRHGADEEVAGSLNKFLYNRHLNEPHFSCHNFSSFDIYTQKGFNIVLEAGHFIFKEGSINFVE